MDPTPPPTPRNRPTVPAAGDIAAADDAAPSPVAVASPQRLFKRDRGADGTSSLPKKAHDPRPSPRRRSVATASVSLLPRVVDDSPSAVSAWDLFATPASRPSPRPVVMSPEQSKRLGEIIAAIRTKPLSAKRAIVPPRMSKPTVVKKAGPPTKAKKPAKQTPRGNESILGSGWFANDRIRPAVFGVTKNLSYTDREMSAHIRQFAKQLKFRFDEKRASICRWICRRISLQIHLQKLYIDLQIDL